MEYKESQESGAQQLKPKKFSTNIKSSLHIYSSENDSHFSNVTQLGGTRSRLNSEWEFEDGQTKSILSQKFKMISCLNSYSLSSEESPYLLFSSQRNYSKESQWNTAKSGSIKNSTNSFRVNLVASPSSSSSLADLEQDLEDPSSAYGASVTPMYNKRASNRKLNLPKLQALSEIVPTAVTSKSNSTQVEKRFIKFRVAHLLEQRKQ